jgi:hypothetical protein
MMRQWLLAPLILVAACSRGNDADNQIAASAPVPDASPLPAGTPGPVATAATPTPTPVPTATSTETATGRASKYTSLGACRTTRTAPDEAGFATSDCPGIGGYRLRLIDSDARQNLMLVGRDGKEHSLRLSEAGGGGFSRIGERIEWRGAQADGPFRPDALVLRYAVVENPANPTRETAYLLPVSLTKSCVAARIPPGPDQNTRARAIADAQMQCR